MAFLSGACGRSGLRGDAVTAGEALRAAVLGSYDLTASEAELLNRAAGLADTLERLEIELAEADLVVAGSRGQDAPHPLLAAQTRAATALARMIEALALPDVEDDEGENSTTRRARHAANVRWMKERSRG